MESSIFLNISLILGIAIGVSFLIQLMKQPLIISYIITGIICGPVFFNLINSKSNYYDIFAQFGVILLLFLVGLSLNFEYLRRIGKVAVLSAIGQFVFTSVFGILILRFLGFNYQASIFLALSITFSSTIIIIKLLTDKQDIRSVYGRYVIGLMLVQDIIAIILMIILPTLHSAETLIFAILILLAKLLIVLSVVYFLSRVVLPIVLERVARSGEFLFMFALAWCFAMAGFGEWLGISLEVGAVIAGLSLGSSVYQTEISSRIRPLRDFFIALFFIILGSEMNLKSAESALIPSVVLSLFIFIGNPLILYIIFRRMKFTRRTSFLAGLTAAQVSEFGFVFLFVAEQMGYIESDILAIFTLVALITIFASSYIITYNSQIYQIFIPFFNLFGKDIHRNPQLEKEKYDVLLFGYHRMGWKLCHELAKQKVKFAVIDFNPETIKRLENKNIPFYFGDANDIEFLEELPVKECKMVISTLPNASDQFTMVEYVRKKNKKCLIIGNLSHILFIKEMYEAGCDYVMVPHLLGAQFMSHILARYSWSKNNFKKLSKEQARELDLREQAKINNI